LQMRNLATALAALAVLSTASHAAEKTMSVDFVGDWCFGDGYDAQAKTTNYKLPSWTEDGRCAKDKILSVNKYGFYFNDTDDHCDVVSVRYTKDTAPSGTGYTAKVTASCSPSGPWAGKTKTFEFYRYKGNLDVKR
jgi:hypothetical protein